MCVPPTGNVLARLKVGILGWTLVLDMKTYAGV
jgi:hypothetical protein